MLGLLNQPFGLDQQNPAGGCQREPLRMPPDKKLGSEFFFQMSNRGRDRRLRYVDTL